MTALCLFNLVCLSVFCDAALSLLSAFHSCRGKPAKAIDKNYKNNQNVRRFMIDEYGPDFRFDRAFMA